MSRKITTFVLIFSDTLLLSQSLAYIYSFENNGREASNYLIKQNPLNSKQHG